MKKNLLMAVFCIVFVCMFFYVNFVAAYDVAESRNWEEIELPTLSLSGGKNISDMFLGNDGKIYISGSEYDSYLGRATVRIYCKNIADSNWEDISFNLSSENISSWSNTTEMLQTSNGTIYLFVEVGNFDYKFWQFNENSWLDITSNLPQGWPYSFLDMVENIDGSLLISYEYGLAGPEKNFWKYSDGVWVNLDVVTGGDPVGLSKINNQIYYSLRESQLIYVFNPLDNTVTNISSGDIQNGSIWNFLQASDGQIYAGGVYYGAYDYTFPKIYKNVNVFWSDISGDLDISHGMSGEIRSLLQADDLSIYAGGRTCSDYALVSKHLSGNSWLDISNGQLGTSNTIKRLLQDSYGIIYALSVNSTSSCCNSSLYKYTSAELEERIKQLEERIKQENNLRQGNRIILKSVLNKQSISSQDLVLYFKKLPNKLTKNNKYWMKWNKFNKYPSKWKKKKKRALKRYWKMTTNLNKYKAKKKKQRFKIQVTFKYSKKLFKKLKKKNKLAKKKNLYLKYRTKKSKWKSLTKVWKKVKIKHKKKKNKFMIKYFTKFPKKEFWFGIGL